MKKILLSALMFSTLAFVSCSKSDDNNSEGGSTDVYLPVKMASEVDLTTFVYDDQNRLVEVKIVDFDDDYSTVTTFVYNNSQLTAAKEITTEVETKQDGTKKEHVSTEDYTFTYQDNEVKVVNIYTSEWGSSTQTSIYKIDSAGNLQSGNGLIVTYDSKGNVTKIVEDEYESTYDYDDKNGMYKNLKTPQWALYLILDEMHVFSVNNITKMTNNDSEGGETDFSNISYQYNSANYPVMMNIVGSDDFSNTVTIEYIKK